MKVLFVTQEHMHQYEGDTRPSPHEYCAIGAGLAQGIDIKRYYIDADNDHKALTGYVANAKPDLVVVTPSLGVGEKFNPDPGQFAYIRGHYKTPVIGLWLESAPNVVGMADAYATCLTANVFVDSNDHWKRYTAYPEKTFFVPEPKDPRLFVNGPSKRDIPLSFAGSVLGRVDRALNIAWLMGRGVEVYHSNGITAEAEAIAPIQNYIDTLRNSYITLNFTSAITFQHINARTSEALMCGCLLFESKSAQTAQLLEPYGHYVPFEEMFHIEEHPPHPVSMQSQTDLIEKVRHYIGPGRKEGEEIAAAGHKKAIELFDGKLFWNRLFEIAGVTR